MDRSYVFFKLSAINFSWVINERLFQMAEVFFQMNFLAAIYFENGVIRKILKFLT